MRTLWAWGENVDGQLGLGDRLPRFSPSRVFSLLDDGISPMTVKCFDDRVILLALSGEVLVWGRHSSLIRSAINDRPPNFPLMLPLSAPNVSVTQIAITATSYVCSSAEGQVFVWGPLCRSDDVCDTPYTLPEFGGPSVIDVTGGNGYVIVTRAIEQCDSYQTDSIVYGNDVSSTIPTTPTVIPLCQSTTIPNSSIFRSLIVKKETVRVISLAATYGGLITDLGRLYMWGTGKFGQLGLGFITTVMDPTLVNEVLMGEEGEKPSSIQQLGGTWIALACGPSHCGAVLKIEHPVTNETTFAEHFTSLFTWGYGSDGQLGHGNKRRETLPRKVIFPASSSARSNGSRAQARVISSSIHDKLIHNINLYPVQSFSVGDRHSVAIVDGDVYSWGLGDSGRLGHNDERSFFSPTRIQSFDKLLTTVNEDRLLLTQRTSVVLSVTCGSDYTFAITDDDGQLVATMYPPRIDSSQRTASSSAGICEVIANETALIALRAGHAVLNLEAERMARDLESIRMQNEELRQRHTAIATLVAILRQHQRQHGNHIEYAHAMWECIKTMGSPEKVLEGSMLSPSSPSSASDHHEQSYKARVGLCNNAIAGILASLSFERETDGPTRLDRTGEYFNPSFLHSLFHKSDMTKHLTSLLNANATERRSFNQISEEWVTKTAQRVRESEDHYRRHQYVDREGNPVEIDEVKRYQVAQQVSEAMTIRKIAIKWKPKMRTNISNSSSPISMKSDSFLKNENQFGSPIPTSLTEPSSVASPSSTWSVDDGDGGGSAGRVISLVAEEIAREERAGGTGESWEDFGEDVGDVDDLLQRLEEDGGASLDLN